MTLRVRANVLLQVWSYDFYDTTLSTKQQSISFADSGTPPMESWVDGYKMMISFTTLFTISL